MRARVRSEGGGLLTQLQSELAKVKVDVLMMKAGSAGSPPGTPTRRGGGGGGGGGRVGSPSPVTVSTSTHHLDVRVADVREEDPAARAVAGDRGHQLSEEYFEPIEYALDVHEVGTPYRRTLYQ